MFVFESSFPTAIYLPNPFAILISVFQRQSPNLSKFAFPFPSTPPAPSHSSLPLPPPFLALLPRTKINQRYCIQFIANYSIAMPERKVWTAQQDRVLKFLFQQRKLAKWSQISRVMQTQFNILGRNGKQCRERYHNHLDKNITNSEWSPEEQNLLFEMQDQVGNKWALISSKLPGRTDNCVKNHFYSKLRKSLRNINKKIHKFMKKEYREIKTTVLYKIIETMENKNRQGVEMAGYELCRKIKNELRDYENQLVHFGDGNEELQFVRTIVEDIALFDKEIKKNPKKLSLKTSLKLEEDSYAKPASCVVSSTKSIYDDESESYSNSELFSSSSFDHRSIHSSQHLLKPHKIFRSQSIQSQSEDDEQSEEGKGVVLYKSANSITRSSLADAALQGEKIGAAALMKTEVLKRDKSFSSQHSNESNKSQRSDQSDSNRMYMFGEESLEMRVLSPRQLTIEEKMEIHENSNDLLFYGDMDIEDDGLIKEFEQMDLGVPVGPQLPSIPKLGKQRFDFS